MFTTQKFRLKTTFSALNVDVPLVVGGLIADPQDELELQLHLRLDKIAGAEKIKNNNLKNHYFLCIVTLVRVFMLLTNYSDNVKYNSKKVHHGKNRFKTIISLSKICMDLSGNYFE